MTRIEAFILAGGKSMRMGQDKGLCPLKKSYMIEHVINAIQNIGLPIQILSSNQDYKRFGYPVIADLHADRGPMGGLYTALRHTQADSVLLLSCDMPLLKPFLLQELIAATYQSPIVYFEYQNKVFPFPGVYSKSIEKQVLENLKIKQLKMTSFLSESNAFPIEITQKNLTYFENVNNKAALEKIEKMTNIQLKAFGIMAEIINCHESDMHFDGDSNALIKHLVEKHPQLENIKFSVAVNKEIINQPTKLNDGDEIALLPPFSGG